MACGGKKKKGEKRNKKDYKMDEQELGNGELQRDYGEEE